ncbi:MAG: zinc ribbon domain-containing protein [Nitrospirota bacterium]
MPIYEYHCADCGADFEKLVFGSPSTVACEQCGSEHTRKRMSQFGMGVSSSGSSEASSHGTGCGGCTSSSCAGCR